MVEQDLVISRALVALFNQTKVQDTLVFRGGTALNKLYIKPPIRYSEDIDLVQVKAEPIGKTLDSVRNALDNWLGKPKRKLTERSAKLVYRYTALDQTPAKLKIEINTTEHFHVQPLDTKSFNVNSEWFKGETHVKTYQLDELMGTKLRALYQRRKGRDLFDLWYVMNHQLVNIDNIISVFEHHCKHNNEPVTRAMFEQSLHFKKQHTDFQSDIIPLLSNETDWNFNNAIKKIEEELIPKLQGKSWKKGYCK